jgi:type II secretory pathway component PulF
MKTPPGDYLYSRRATGRTAFFRTLARYCQAGITLDRGLYYWAAGLPRHKRMPFQMLAQQVQNGQTLADAGLERGVLQPWEAGLLAIGNVHGRMDRVLDELATDHEQATARWNRLRLRLLFAVGILVPGFLVLTLTRLASGQLSVNTFLLQNLLLAAILLLLWGAPAMWRRRRRFPDMILRCKTLGKPAWQFQRYRFIHQLACLYNAGVTITDALPVAVKGCDSMLLRSRWSMIEEAVRQGSGISEALHRHAALDETGYALVHSGEASGRLGEMLDHEARRLGKDVDLWQDGLIDWLPRLAYLLVLLLLFSF